MTGRNNDVDNTVKKRRTGHGRINRNRSRTTKDRDEKNMRGKVNGGDTRGKRKTDENRRENIDGA